MNYYVDKFYQLFDYFLELVQGYTPGKFVESFMHFTVFY